MTAGHDQLALLHDRAALDASLGATAEGTHGEYGAIFTRRWVVELILDLSGYLADEYLASKLVLEPACGSGAFLAPIVERLAQSCENLGRPISDAHRAIYACDLQPANVEASRALVEKTLVSMGNGRAESRDLARAWVHHDDFLLNEHRPGIADFVIGNPPYIRLESIPPARNGAYRQACATMAGRSDVYIGFFEVGLRALKDGGVLGFICADRWMRNQYGMKLRRLVTEQYCVAAAVEMHDVDAFEEEVSAYPSITILRRTSQGPAFVARAKPTFGARSAERLRISASRSDRTAGDPDFDAAWLPSWFPGRSSWPTGSPERLALLNTLESRLPPLEDERTSTRVGIGVATGADRIFITQDQEIVEQDRLLPMAMARDTLTGEIQWSGNYLIDPWDGDSGQLVDLSAYPRLRIYLEERATGLRKRNVAGRRPHQWYRTIDRVDHALTDRPKLFMPDIKAAIHPVLEEGGLYPHHNLYFVVSDKWDPEVLGGILLSRVAQFFIESYAVRMRGGYLRFQAQYLRRIRVPRLQDLREKDQSELRRAFDARDVERATHTTLPLYDIEHLPE